MRLLVVGGGITGLSAAWEAVGRGADVVVCEAGERWGGKVVTDRVDGTIVDLGPDSVVAYRPAALTLARELGLGDDVIAAAPGRRVSMHARGKMLPMPDGMGMVLPTKIWPFVTTRILSWPDKLRAGLDLVLPRRLGPEDTSIGSLLRGRLGGGIVTRFADPMVGGIYGSSVDELSLDAVLPSLRANEETDRSLMLASIRGGRKARQAKGATAGPSSPFRSLAGGMGTLSDALAEQLTARGARLLLGTRVEALELTADGRTTATLMGAGVESAVTETFDGVVLAGGVASSRALLAEAAPAAAEALAGIPLASTTVVTFAFDADAFPEPVTTQGWLEAQQAPISGVTVSSVKYPGRADEGTVLVRAFVPERLGDLCHAPEAELLAAVEPWVRRNLHALRPPRWHRIARWAHVMPKYTVGHLDRVAAVDAALEALPTWRVAGSALRGVGLPDCVDDGRAQAGAVLTAAEAAA